MALDFVNFFHYETFPNFVLLDNLVRGRKRLLFIHPHMACVFEVRIFICDSYIALLILLLYEAIRDESAKLCFIFRNVHSVQYFPLENIVLEIVLRMRYNEPVKVCLCSFTTGK